jgi:colanic acid/amylovoran biosynthesis protein
MVFEQYVFYSHINSGNRGCEAITRSTCEILGLEKKHTAIFSEDLELDTLCGLEKYGYLYPVRQYHGMKPLSALPFRVMQKMGLDKTANVKYRYADALGRLQAGTLALSTGGDLYCYDDSQWVIYLHQVAQKRRAATVLWGCSIEKKNIDRSVRTDLRQYDLITARETLTAQNLYDNGIQNNVQVFPDPAFILSPQSCDLPREMERRNTVGINMSNLVCGREDIVFKGIIKLIRYILDNTDMIVLLVPHVFWPGQDDIAVLQKIFKEINHKRVAILTEFHNCCELKYIISNCRFFIGARTHSVIAAYSSSVPTLALGYSIKSKGILKDLGLSEQLVMDSKKIENENELIKAFLYLAEQEQEIKRHLNTRISDYQKKAYMAKLAIEKLA